MSRPFRHRLRARYGECDMQGAVFNANYLTYFDVAITELWREAYGPWDSFTARGLDMVVAEATIRYRAPVRFDDEFEIETVVERLGTTAITTRLTIVRDGERLTEGTIRHVVIDASSGAKTAIPDDIRRALEPFVAAAPEAAR